MRWWVRADKSNQAIGAKFPWTGVQGSASNCDYNAIQSTPEPSTNLDPATGQQRVVLKRETGWFQHRIWDGMCLWNGERQRSAINGSDAYSDLSSIKRGKEYWFAFGGKFHVDMFSQTDPSEDYSTSFMDFHHKSPSSALSGQTPWVARADRSGYFLRVIWNKSDSGRVSPTGEKNWDGAEMVTMLRDTSKDTTKPHFFAMRFLLDWDVANKPYVELYRQIGVDGPIAKVGRWDVPNTYQGSDNLLFPKYGLHHWHQTLNGGKTRSIDMVGALLVEDLAGSIALTPETIFRSLTVAVPR